MDVAGGSPGKAQLSLGPGGRQHTCARHGGSGRSRSATVRPGQELRPRVGWSRGPTGVPGCPCGVCEFGASSRRPWEGPLTATETTPAPEWAVAQASLATAAGAPEDSVPAGRSCDRSPRTPAPRGTWRSVVSPSRVRSPRAGFPPCAGRRSATVPRLPEPWRPERARPRPGWFPGGRHLRPPRHRVPAPPGLLRLCLRMDPLVFKRSACRKSRRFVHPGSSCRWHFLLSHVTVNRCVRNPLPL